MQPQRTVKRQITMGEASRPSRCFRAGVFVLAGVLWLGGCESGEHSRLRAQRDPMPAPADTCEGVKEAGTELPADFRVTGRGLAGDVDGDRRPDRVTLRESVHRPEACRRAVVVEPAVGEIMAALVGPLDWPSADPKILLLADIDGRPGLEPVVALSPGAVFRPGAVFTVSAGHLARMRMNGEDLGSHSNLFPFYDEFPTGVDCTDSSGEIVVTVSQFAPQGDDSVFGVTRTFYRPDRATFRSVDQEEFVVDCCNEEAKQRWPETADDPFRSCPGRVQ
jgi:hypothetical protein